MNSFLLDASALAKRYHLEAGSALVDHLFAAAGHSRLQVLLLAAAEVVSVLVRRRNAGTISPVQCSDQMNVFRAEVVANPNMQKVGWDADVIVNSFDLIDRHSINANDAIVLRAALEVANRLRVTSDDLVLVAADQRLVKAAQAESLLTFDPETQTQADLDKLIGP